ncbi:MAG: peroxisome- protein [Chrysothrix sp. TS-e1954]|nr:MAG: peroxisome- protein [Chrysothrix sp. TS-e1954]
MPASRSASISVDGPSTPHQPDSPSSNPSSITAPFSLTSSTLASRQQRSSIVIHRKSPLLVATPPQITRALAHSHPFLLPLSRFAGLLSWTTEDPWESFLLVCTFWGTVLYGDTVLRFTGPLVLAANLILLMYLRRFSPLSSTGWNTSTTPKKATHARKESQQQHQKSLDDIVASLNTLTARFQILLDPFLKLTDFLSTQSTATSATTRPALTAFSWRILVLTPIWYILTLHPLYIITTKRLVLLLGTLFLTWHSRPARASRTILWRSKLVRRSTALLTGLDVAPPLPARSRGRKERPPPLPARPKASPSRSTLKPNYSSKGTSDAEGSGKEDGEAIRFTFILYENQRRWLGIGWTASLLAYERSAWTDESLNPTSSKDTFTLPDVTDSNIARWRWARGSEWQVEPSSPSPLSHGETASDAGSRHGHEGDDEEGWEYTDNKWRDPKLQDSWGRYTRRRRWVRDAELLDSDKQTTPTVEVTDDGGSTVTAVDGKDAEKSEDQMLSPSSSTSATAATTTATPEKRKSWLFRRRSQNHNREPSSDTDAPASDSSSKAPKLPPRDTRADSIASTVASSAALSEDDDGYVPLRFRFGGRERDGEWGAGENMGMELG